jgi:hypothetical protein
MISSDTIFFLKRSIHIAIAYSHSKPKLIALYILCQCKKDCYLPIGLDKLKEENSDLYKIVNNSLKLGLVGYITTIITQCNF